MNEIILQISLSLLPVAVFYGAFLQRIKILERQMQEHNTITERLASVETKLDFLINKK
jgi:uncharacterized protein YneF (UPF0154 family)